jgi:ElaB/YqjD/DUF883 family membrane-anchored ribosome-binding protein
MEQSNERSMDDLSQSRTTSGTASISGSTGSTGSMGSAGSTDDTTQSSGVKDRARELAGSAQDRLADVGSSVRERAGHLKDSLADALETGADKLRAKGTGQSQGGALVGATGSASVAVENDGRVAQVSNRVAGGMDATADWLRQADLDGLRASVEQQVKEHPGRSLLIAAGVGYLVGKALRK